MFSLPNLRMEMMCVPWFEDQILGRGEGGMWGAECVFLLPSHPPFATADLEMLQCT